MRMNWHRTWLLALCWVPLLALAQRDATLEQRLTPAQMHETGLDTLMPSQLARLNAILREDERQAPPRGPGVAMDSGAQPMFAIGLDDKPIRSRVRGDVRGWEPGTVFELENGQQWKVLKGRMTLRRTLPSPEIQLVPGVAGRWFLQLDEDTPKPRVYRIR